MRVQVLRLLSQSGGSRHLHGATVGQLHREALISELLATGDLADGPGATVVFDFEGIESATASYLKATVLALVRAGMKFADGNKDNGPGEVPPLNVFPVVEGLSSEIAEELSEVLTSNSLLCIEAVRRDGAMVWVGRLHGKKLDRSIGPTLDALVCEGRATALRLHEKYPQQPPITPNGWLNRLAELYRLRLARREKQGRQFVYIPVAVEMC